jgi:hypothetical protein
MAQVTNGDGQGGIDVLSDVELLSFTALPDQIGSFGASQLAWEVQGPQTGFHVTLNGVTVARVGGEIVQPQTTTSYHLNAVSAGVTKGLRTITIRVDDTGCEINSPFVNPQATIRGFLNSQIDARKDLYFKAGTEVIFSPGKIQFKLHLGKSSSGYPDPSIEIDASLGLVVSQGHIVSTVQNINANVGYSAFEWMVFGAVIELQLLLSNNTNALSNANADAHNSAQELITGIGQLVDGTSVFSNRMLIKRNVLIGVDGDGHGTIDIQACPNNLLVMLAEASSVGNAE